VDVVHRSQARLGDPDLVSFERDERERVALGVLIAVGVFVGAFDRDFRRPEFGARDQRGVIERPLLGGELLAELGGTGEQVGIGDGDREDVAELG
jgi:hypothetical protein